MKAPQKFVDVQTEGRLQYTTKEEIRAPTASLCYAVIMCHRCKVTTGCGFYLYSRQRHTCRDERKLNILFTEQIVKLNKQTKVKLIRKRMICSKCEFGRLITLI